jgi:hypothetical protein
VYDQETSKFKRPRPDLGFCEIKKCMQLGTVYINNNVIIHV